MRGRLGAISDMRVPGGLATKWPSPFRSPQLRDSRPQAFLWELLYGKFGWPIRADCN